MLGRFSKVLLITMFAVANFIAMPALAKAVGTFSVVKGKVWIVSKKGKKKKARIGKKIKSSDTVLTEKDSRAKLTMLDKNVINISPDTELKLEKYVFDPKKNKKDVLLNVIYGKVRSNVQQKYDGKKNRFQVKTKAAVAGVRGTDFLSGFSRRTGRASFVTFSGMVAVGLPTPNGVITAWVPVAPGQISEVNVGGKVTTKRLSRKALANLNKATDAGGGADDPRVPANDGAGVNNDQPDEPPKEDDPSTGKEKNDRDPQSDGQGDPNAAGPGDPNAGPGDGNGGGDPNGVGPGDKKDGARPEGGPNGGPDGAMSPGGPGGDPGAGGGPGGRDPSSVMGPGDPLGGGLGGGMVGADDLPSAPTGPNFDTYQPIAGMDPILPQTDVCAINPLAPGCGGNYTPPDLTEICPFCGDTTQNGKTRLIIDVINGN